MSYVTQALQQLEKKNTGQPEFLQAAREVLLHELCHLREPAHTPAFWRLLTDMMPDWAEWEGVLRCLGARLRAAGS